MDGVRSLEIQDPVGTGFNRHGPCGSWKLWMRLYTQLSKSDSQIISVLDFGLMVSLVHLKPLDRHIFVRGGGGGKEDL